MAASLGCIIRYYTLAVHRFMWNFLGDGGDLLGDGDGGKIGGKKVWQTYGTTYPPTYGPTSGMGTG